MSQATAQPAAEPLVKLLSQALDDNRIEVPLLPQVAAEVLSTTLDDRSNAQRLPDLIDQDQALASHILRVVNSPAFRGSAEIIALRQAIARLGMERIREIALTISMQGTLHKPGPFEAGVQEAWQYGLRTALWAKEVARHARKNVEVGYLCGLLHNVGVPILLNQVAEISPQSSLEDACDAARMLAGRAGVMLVTEWGLPGVVSGCIEHADDLAQADEFADAVATLQAAQYLATHQQADEVDIAQAQGHSAMQYLNFYPDDLEGLAAHAAVIQQTIEGMG